MRHASQSKAKSYGRVQGNNEIILASMVGIGLRQLQPNYGQVFLCVYCRMRKRNTLNGIFEGQNGIVIVHGRQQGGKRPCQNFTGLAERCLQESHSST